MKYKNNFCKFILTINVAKMNEHNIIKSAEYFVRKNSRGYDSGHDWWHIDRVRNIALYINKMEGNIVDAFILEMCALLHDIADTKFSGNNTEGIYELIAGFLSENNLENQKERIFDVIRNVSFSNKNKKQVKDQLLKILQDADRLDAIGAIGVARAFSYGGFKNRPMFIPGSSYEESNSTIGHFYEKLLKLKDMMNTKTGRELAKDRHIFLEKFLEQFYNEINIMVRK
jgi:uncharacterized protein